MPKYYDENGNEVTDVVSKTDSDAAIEAAKIAAIDTYKVEHPEPVVQTEDTTAVDALKTQIDTLTKDLAKKDQDAAIARFTGGDTDKEALVRAEFDKMGGYEDVGARAAAAAKVALGEAKVVNVGDYSGAGSGRAEGGQGNAPLSRPVDLDLQKKLGISAEDVVKYGPKIEESAS